MGGASVRRAGLRGEGRDFPCDWGGGQITSEKVNSLTSAFITPRPASCRVERHVETYDLIFLFFLVSGLISVSVIKHHSLLCLII